MKRQILVLWLLAMSFALAGCKQDGEVTTILATIDSFTTELIARIETAPAANHSMRRQHPNSRVFG